jgi:hypothetical protein
VTSSRQAEPRTVMVDVGTVCGARGTSPDGKERWIDLGMRMEREE